MIVKTAAEAGDLERINRYTRRAVTMDEVYTFSVILCDNEIDRDGECFTVDSLRALAALFLGKTGIFDHDPKASTQTARIYDTEVVANQDRRTRTGEVYHALKAKAYLMRSEETKQLMLEIDGGIKKEVSVGCSVRHVRCSVCGADLRREGCDHRLGEWYGDRLCYAKLEEPTDAYEFSFVAIPAQREAGVVKGFQKQRGMDEVEKALKSGECVTLTKGEARALAVKLQQLTEAKRFEEPYKALLIGQVVQDATLLHAQFPAETMEPMLRRMAVEELEALHKQMHKRAWDRPTAPQLGADEAAAPPQKNDSFKLV